MTWTLSAFADEAGPTSDEQIAALQRAGLRFIDLRSVDGHNIVDLPVEDAKRIKTKFDDAGIAVSMYGSPIGKIDIEDDLGTDLDRLNHLAKMRDVFGCEAVRIFSYYNRNGADKDAWEQAAVDRLLRLRDEAGRLDLQLYHENESDIFGDHPDDVLRLAELRDGETFFLIYDFANYIRTGVDGWASWRMMRNKTDCFHFKDMLVIEEGGEGGEGENIKRRHQHVPMGGSEDTQAKRILADAYEADWEGPCTLEPHLKASEAVLATGFSGEANRSLKDLSAQESFQVAAEAARRLLDEVGVEYR